MTPQNLTEFNQCLDSLYVCQCDGPPRAYFEVLRPVDLRGHPGVEIWRFRYTVIRVGADRFEDAWAALWAYLMPKLKFASCDDGAPLIFWRRRPETRMESSGSPGTHDLYCRLVIPGVDLAAECAEGSYGEPAVILRATPDGVVTRLSHFEPPALVSPVEPVMGRFL